MRPSDLVVVEDEVDVPRPLCVVPDEVIVTLRSLLLSVAREHALQTDAHALDIVNGRPALSIEQIEAYNAVGVDVRVPGDRVCLVADKCDFWCL